MMAYLIDTDIFIAAKNLHYGMDFCPAFWEWLTDANRAGKILSTEAVYDDLSGRCCGRRKRGSFCNSLQQKEVLHERYLCLAATLYKN